MSDAGLPPLVGEIVMEDRTGPAFDSVQRAAQATEREFELSIRSTQEQVRALEELSRAYSQYEAKAGGGISSTGFTRGGQNVASLDVAVELGISQDEIQAKLAKLKDDVRAQGTPDNLIDTEAFAYLADQAVVEIFQDRQQKIEEEIERRVELAKTQGTIASLTNNAFQNIGNFSAVDQIRFSSEQGRFVGGDGRGISDTSVAALGRISQAEIDARVQAMGEGMAEGLARGLTERKAALADALLDRQSPESRASFFQDSIPAFDFSQNAPDLSAIDKLLEAIEPLINIVETGQRVLLILGQIGIAVGSVTAAVRFMNERFEETGRRELQIAELNRQLGDAPQKIRAVSDALGGAVSDEQIREALGTISDVSVLAVENTLSGVSEVVQARASQLSQTWIEVMPQVVQAIEQGNGPLLEQMGLIDDAQGAINAYAREIGVAVPLLNQYQVAQALANAVLAENRDIVSEQLTPYQEMRRSQEELAASASNLGESFNSWVTALLNPNSQSAAEFWLNFFDVVRDGADRVAESLDRSAEGFRRYADVTTEGGQVVLQTVEDQIATLREQADIAENSQGVRGRFFRLIGMSPDSLRQDAEELQRQLDEALAQIEESGTFDANIFAETLRSSVAGNTNNIDFNDLFGIPELPANVREEYVAQLRQQAEDAWALARLEDIGVQAGDPDASSAKADRLNTQAEEISRTADLVEAQNRLADATEEVTAAEARGADEAARFADVKREVAELDVRLLATRTAVIQTSEAVAAAESELGAAVASGVQLRIVNAAQELQAAEARDESARAAYDAAQAEAANAQAMRDTLPVLEQMRASEEDRATAAQESAVQYGYLIDSISGLPVAWDEASFAMLTAEDRTLALARAMSELDANVQSVANNAAASSFRIAQGFAPFIGIEASLQKGAEFAQQQADLTAQFNQLNQQRVDNGQAALSADVLGAFTGALSDRQQAELSELQRLNSQVGDSFDDLAERIDDALDSIAAAELGPTTRGLIDLDELLPREDEVDERARRMADIAVKGFESPWYDGLKDLFPDDVINAGEEKIKEAAARMVRDHQEGLTTIFYDTDLAAQRVIERLQANLNQDELIASVREKVKEQIGSDPSLSDLDLQEALGIDTTAQRTAAAVKSALEGTFSAEELSAQLAEVFDQNPLTKMVEVDGEDETEIKDKATFAATVAGEGFVGQIEDGNYGPNAVGKLKTALGDKDAQKAMSESGAQLAVWLGDTMTKEFSENVPPQLLSILTTELLPLMAAALANSDARAVG